MTRQILECKTFKTGKISQSLMDDGWKTPDTYGNNFSPISQISAVYLFLLVDRETFGRSLVAYVGMSTQLKTRMSGHEVLGALNIQGYWAMRWFKPTPVDALRSVELSYIKKYDPPWNISGRTRGIMLQ